MDEGFLNKAQIQNPALGDTLNNLLLGSGGTGFFAALLPSLVRLAFVIGSVVFLFMFIMGAIQWITSGGDKTGLEGARGKITNALIGIILLLVSFAIIRLIEAFFSVNILELDIGALKIE